MEDQQPTNPLSKDKKRGKQAPGSGPAAAVPPHLQSSDKQLERVPEEGGGSDPQAAATSLPARSPAAHRGSTSRNSSVRGSPASSFSLPAGQVGTLADWVDEDDRAGLRRLSASSRGSSRHEDIFPEDLVPEQVGGRGRRPVAEGCSGRGSGKGQWLR